MAGGYTFFFERAFNAALPFLTNPVTYIVSVLIIFYFWKKDDTVLTGLYMVFLVAPIMYILIFGLAEIRANEKYEKQKWEAWAEDKCKIIEKRQGSTSLESGLGISTSGQPIVGTMTNSTPDQTAYKCDDGITYWRNN
ncbi:hypothetical protein ACRWP7_003298 [Escherichia coli]